MISMMKHFLSSGEVQVNPAMDFSYPHNYVRYEDSNYYNVNGVGMTQNIYQNSNINYFVQQDEVCEICGDYSHSAHNCPYHPQYENYHYSRYAPPQPDFSGFMSHPQVPQHERNQRCHQSLSLDEMMMEVMESLPECWQTCNNIQKLDDTLINLEMNDVTQGRDYLIETSDFFPIEPEIVMAFNEGEDEMEIEANSDMSEKPHIESEEDQLLVLVQPPTLPCTFGTPYKGVEVRERLQILYTADTFVLDEPDMIDSFVLEVPDELLILKEGVHVSLPKHVDAPFVVDISKGEGIT
ncbi:hypothetical protein Syun_006858 [Stephania yunnanensis]|uniref:Uncharacterized protein n=1 Tax=Stephania yunnanensis TaxID=152371 RepID=A0AAP0KZ42_9MAGN